MSIHHRPHGGNANPHDPWTCNLSPNWPHDCPQCMADYPPPPDAWELANGTDPLSNDANADPDFDGFTNLQEY